MEGQMDAPINTKNPDFGSGRYKLDPEFRQCTDATGNWFAAAVVFAFLAAGVIVYRSANVEFNTASNNIAPPAAQADPISPAPLLR
jgi:hypothetical protein